MLQACGRDAGLATAEGVDHTLPIGSELYAFKGRDIALSEPVERLLNLGACDPTGLHLDQIFRAPATVADPPVDDIEVDTRPMTGLPRTGHHQWGRYSQSATGDVGERFSTLRWGHVSEVTAPTSAVPWTRRFSASGGGLEERLDDAVKGTATTSRGGELHAVAGDPLRETHHRTLRGSATRTAVGKKPLNIELRHRRRGYRVPETQMPQLAVVIATLNRPRAVLDALSDVVTQAPGDTEIAVVDQSDPGAFAQVATGIAALSDDRIRHIRRTERGLVGARNCGVAATVAPVVLFLDDDVRLKPGCIQGHLRAFIDPTLGGVVGRIEERVVRPNATSTQNRLDLGGRIRTNLTGEYAVPIQTLKGANMSFRRSALRDAGAFDPAYRGTAFLEDADMSWRVAKCGWSLRYEPGAALEHLSLPAGGVRVGSPLETEVWRFRNTAYFMRRHRGSGAAVPMTLTFGAIAARRAIEWSSLRAVPRLMRGLARGWREGGNGPGPTGDGGRNG